MPSLVLPDGSWANQANCAFDARRELGSDADRGSEPGRSSLGSAERSASDDLVDAINLQNYERVEKFEGKSYIEYTTFI